MPLRSNGSLSMNRALMAAGLVDPVFHDAPDLDLELIESRTLDRHTQELIYRPPCTPESR